MSTQSSTARAAQEQQNQGYTSPPFNPSENNQVNDSTDESIILLPMQSTSPSDSKGERPSYERAYASNQIKLPEYDGSTDIRYWTDLVSAAALHNQWDDVSTSLQAQVKLHGQALLYVSAEKLSDPTITTS
jgi:hypothetical protein